jgi:hypothetical protein
MSRIPESIDRHPHPRRRKRQRKPPGACTPGGSRRDASPLRNQQFGKSTACPPSHPQLAGQVR